jgi:hypothetical protein
MNAKTKIAIFLVAVMVSLVGFSLIASPAAVDMFKLGKTPTYNVDVVVTAQAGSNAQPVVHINGLP